MPALTDIALWGAGLLLGTAAAIVVALIAVRALRSSFSRHLGRKVERVQGILRRHAGDEYDKVDRLLFELGKVQDNEAVEAALNQLLETGDHEVGPRLLKIYKALGLIDHYIEQLRKSSRWATRAAAAKGLGQLRAVEAIPGLVAAMRDPHEDNSVKLAAGQALALMRAVDAIPPLIEELGQPDDWASPRLAELLVKFGEQAIEPLQEALGDERRTNSRVWAAQVLGRIGEKSASMALMSRMQDRSERVRISVTEALGRLRDKSAVPDLLRLALNDPVPAVRAEAARALGAVGDASVLGELVLLLSASDYWTRLRAVEAIEKLRPSDTYPLEQALSDDSEVVRAEAARALERLGVLDRWLDDLENEDTQAASAASERLVKFGKTGTVDSLLTRTEHPSLRTRSRLCKVLAQVGDTHALPVIVELLKDKAWPVRAHAADAIARLRPDNAAELLVPLLSDEEEMVRVAAIGAIQAIGVPNIQGNLPALIALYTRGNAEARCSVIDSIEHVPTEKVSDLLLKALDDPNADVRLHAIRQVSNRPEEIWTKTLTERLADSDTRVRKAAAQALAQTGSHGAVKAMAESLSTHDREFREILTDVLARQSPQAIVDVIGDSRVVEKRLALAWALGKTRDPAAFPELEKLARDERPEVRASAAGALSKIEHPHAEDLLASLLDDPNERVRSAAINGIGAIRAESRLPSLLPLLGDPHQFVRNRLALALGSIGSADAVKALHKLRRKSNEASPRAFVAVGFGLVGDSEGRRLALEGLADDELRPHIERVIAAEIDGLGERFRENLALDGTSPGESMSISALSEHFVHQLTNSRDETERLEALQSLRAVGVVHHLDTLMHVVSSDPSPEVRSLAIECLTPSLSDSTVLTSARRALRDPIVSVQKAAVESLAQTSDPENNHALLHCSALTEPEVASAIERALVRANEGRVPAFLDELMGYAEPAALAVGARVLGSIGDSRAERLLSSWATNGDGGLRVAAIEALGILGTVAAKETLIDSLSDPREEIRCAGADALTRLPLRGLEDALIKLARDPSVRVRSRLAQRLGSSMDLAAIEIVTRLFEDPDEDVRTEAFVSLLRFATDTAISAFAGAFESQPDRVRKAVRGRIDESGIIGGVCELAISHRRPEARTAAVAVLGALGGGPRETLRQVLRDPEPAVRVAAIRVCAAIDDLELASALEGMLDDPVLEVRDAARKARLRVVGSHTEHI